MPATALSTCRTATTMHRSDAAQLADKINALAEVFARPALTQRALEIWYDTLREFQTEAVFDCLNSWPKKHARFPAPSEVWTSVNERAINTREATAKQDHETALSTLPAPAWPPSATAEAHIAHIRELVRTWGRRRPGIWWAHRILERHAAGEYFAPISLRLANEAIAERRLPDTPVVERVPGEDDA